LGSYSSSFADAWSALHRALCEPAAKPHRMRLQLGEIAAMAVMLSRRHCPELELAIPCF